LCEFGMAISIMNALRPGLLPNLLKLFLGFIYNNALITIIIIIKSMLKYVSMDIKLLPNIVIGLVFWSSSKNVDTTHV
jgi:hypothetical protein